METEAKVCSRKERMEDIMFKFLAIKAPTDRIRNVAKVHNLPEQSKAKGTVDMHNTAFFRMTSVASHQEQCLRHATDQDTKDTVIQRKTSNTDNRDQLNVDSTGEVECETMQVKALANLYKETNGHILTDFSNTDLDILSSNRTDYGGFAELADLNKLVSPKDKSIKAEFSSTPISVSLNQGETSNISITAESDKDPIEFANDHNDFNHNHKRSPRTHVDMAGYEAVDGETRSTTKHDCCDEKLASVQKPPCVASSPTLLRASASFSRQKPVQRKRRDKHPMKRERTEQAAACAGPPTAKSNSLVNGITKNSDKAHQGARRETATGSLRSRQDSGDVTLRVAALADVCGLPKKPVKEGVDGESVNALNERRLHDIISKNDRRHSKLNDAIQKNDVENKTIKQLQDLNLAQTGNANQVLKVGPVQSKKLHAWPSQDNEDTNWSAQLLQTDVTRRSARLNRTGSIVKRKGSKKKKLNHNKLRGVPNGNTFHKLPDGHWASWRTKDVPDQNERKVIKDSTSRNHSAGKKNVPNGEAIKFQQIDTTKSKQNGKINVDKGFRKYVRRIVKKVEKKRCMENDTGKAAMSPDQPFERSVVEWKQSKSEPLGRGGIDTDISNGKLECLRTFDNNSGDPETVTNGEGNKHNSGHEDSDTTSSNFDTVSILSVEEGREENCPTAAVDENAELPVTEHHNITEETTVRTPTLLHKQNQSKTTSSSETEQHDQPLPLQDRRNQSKRIFGRRIPGVSSKGGYVIMQKADKKKLRQIDGLKISGTTLKKEKSPNSQAVLVNVAPVKIKSRDSLSGQSATENEKYPEANESNKPRSCDANKSPSRSHRVQSSRRFKKHAKNKASKKTSRLTEASKQFRSKLKKSEKSEDKRRSEPTVPPGAKNDETSSLDSLEVNTPEKAAATYNNAANRGDTSENDKQAMSRVQPEVARDDDLSSGAAEDDTSLSERSSEGCCDIIIRDQQETESESAGNIDRTIVDTVIETMPDERFRELSITDKITESGRTGYIRGTIVDDVPVCAGSIACLELSGNFIQSSPRTLSSEPETAAETSEAGAQSFGTPVAPPRRRTIASVRSFTALTAKSNGNRVQWQTLEEFATDPVGEPLGLVQKSRPGKTNSDLNLHHRSVAFSDIKHSVEAVPKRSSADMQHACSDQLVSETAEPPNEKHAPGEEDSQADSFVVAEDGLSGELKEKEIRSHQTPITSDDRTVYREPGRSDFIFEKRLGKHSGSQRRASAAAAAYTETPKPPVRRSKSLNWTKQQPALSKPAPRTSNAIGIHDEASSSLVDILKKQDQLRLNRSSSRSGASSRSSMSDEHTTVHTSRKLLRTLEGDRTFEDNERTPTSLELKDFVEYVKVLEVNHGSRALSTPYVAGNRTPGLSFEQGGDIYVSDSDGECIAVYSNDGQHKYDIDIPGAPRGLASYTSRHVLCASSADGDVCVVDIVKGAVVRRAGYEGKLKNPRCVAMHPCNQTFLVSDVRLLNQWKIALFDIRQDNIVHSLRPTETADYQVGWPEFTTFKLNSDYEIFATDSQGHALLAYDFRGRPNPTMTIGCRGHQDGQFISPRGIVQVPGGRITLDSAPGGSLLVADWGNNRVSAFDATTGQFQCHVISEEQEPLKNPFDLKTDVNGILYLTESGSNNVKVFRPS